MDTIIKTGSTFYVDSVVLTIGKEKEVSRYKDKEITDELLNKIKLCINEEKLIRLDTENIRDAITMTVFGDKNIFHFGIVDMFNEIIYYYDNGTNNTEKIGIAGSKFMRKMICDSKDVVFKAICYFMKYGKNDDSLSWIIE